MNTPVKRAKSIALGKKSNPSYCPTLKRSTEKGLLDTGKGLNSIHKDWVQYKYNTIDCVYSS